MIQFDSWEKYQIQTVAKCAKSKKGRMHPLEYKPPNFQNGMIWTMWFEPCDLDGQSEYVMITPYTYKVLLESSPTQTVYTLHLTISINSSWLCISYSNFCLVMFAKDWQLNSTWVSLKNTEM